MIFWKGYQGQGRAASQARLLYARVRWGISVRNGAQMRKKRARTHVRGSLNECWRHNADDSSIFLYEVPAWLSQVYLKDLEWYECPCSGSNTLAYFFFFSLLLLFLNLFIYFWLCWVFVAASGLSLVGARRGYPLLNGVRASHCGGFSCCGPRALGERAQELWLVGSRPQAQ